jgi:hypothetical protein
MCSIEGIKTAAVLFANNELWAFYTHHGLEDPSENIRPAMQALQPYYAIPSHYIPLTEMPMTA